MSKPWSKDMKLDLTTFGSSPACRVLADMMNNNMIPISDKHRVLSFINAACYSFKCLAAISEYRVSQTAMSLMRDDFIRKTMTMPYPEKFNSFMRNVISHHYKRYVNVATKIWKKKLGQSMR